MTDLIPDDATPAAARPPLSAPTANHTAVVPESPVLTAARDYAARGWRVIPIKAGEKRPTLSDWVNVATVDPDKIANWWGHGDRYGVGIVTGPESGIWVLDVDVANDKPGVETLAELQRTHAHLPTTVKAKTGSGGLHYFFRWPTDGTIIGTNGGRLGPGLDVRGAGGQVVAAPTVHPNGEPYRWWPGRSPDDVDVADAPAWLLELLRPAEPTTPTLASGSGPLIEARGTGSSGPFGPDEHDDSPAAWFNDHTTWDQLLTRDGWTLTRTFSSGEQQWTRPGKTPRDGISATVNHAGRDCLKVFTSSVPELAADQAYSRFGYEAAMRHHGDRSALARDVRATQMPRQHDDLSWAAAAASTAPLPELPQIDPGTGEIIEPPPIDHGWNPADMGVILAADYQPPVPELLHRTDGHALLYEARINALWGESGSGKTWLAQLTMAQVLLAGGVVLDIDHEDTAAGASMRLRALGVPDHLIEHGFVHIAPEQRWNDLAASMLHHLIADRGITLAVIDSTGEAMASDGVKPNDDDDVARWHQALPKFLTRRGVTVLLIDHIPKSNDGPKLHAIGSQRKRAAITGAAYMVEAAVSPARGVTGHLKVVCAKDRHGAHQRGQLVADATVTSNPAGTHVNIELAAHQDVNRPTVLMARVSAYLERLTPHDEVSTRDILKAVSGNDKALRLAIEVLVDEGHVEMRMKSGRGGGAVFRSIKPFHEHDGDTDFAPETAPSVDNSEARNGSFGTGTAANSSEATAANRGQTAATPDNALTSTNANRGQPRPTEKAAVAATAATAANPLKGGRGSAAVPNPPPVDNSHPDEDPYADLF